jgi:nitroreductase
MLKEIETRRSIRSYTSRPVEDETVARLLEAARLAPSGSNTQPWHFIVVRSRETMEKLVHADHRQAFMLQAPVFLVCVADMKARTDREVSVREESPDEELKQIIRDTAIATEHIVLEARHLGLSTCWTGWFRQDDVRPVLGIPEDKYVVCILTLGYSDATPRPVPRRSLEEIVHREKW